MPYKSSAQRKFFHTATARKKGIKAAVVDEFDSASKGMKLPAKKGLPAGLAKYQANKKKAAFHASRGKIKL
jgi:hypothetical protein